MVARVDRSPDVHACANRPELLEVGVIALIESALVRFFCQIS